MKKLLLFLLMLSPLAGRSQAIITSWKMNNNGQKASYWANNGGGSYTFTVATDSADALKVCYNADTAWLYSRDMSDSMGKWSNPGNPSGQPTVHRFLRNPQAATGTHTVSPKVGEIGMLINGIQIYGLGDAYSWNGTANVQGPGGSGIWNREVGKGEGVSLDNTLGAHPQQQGVYHTHVAPYKLWNRLPTTQHSPIVGWAFDGYPIYGPYGYSSAMNASSSVTRMKSGYSLRNITTRTNYPAIPGGGGATSQTGPPVNATYPIGTYCEDYEWLASNGDLDEYNGRTCVTPEFPGGTYAYFVTIDAAGVPVFPYYIGIYYKGVVDAKNFPQGPNGNGLTIPSYLSSCRYASGAAGVGVNGVSNSGASLHIYPNPATGGSFTIAGNGHSYDHVTVMDMQGRRVFAASLDGNKDYRIQLSMPGLYLVRCDDSAGGLAKVERMVVE